MKLKEYICTLKKRADSPRSNKVLLELQKLSAQEVMSSLKKAHNPLKDLTAGLDKLDRWFPMNRERLCSLNMTFQELRKLQNIQEDLALNLQNFESLTQEIVPRLQDSKDILSKVTRRLEKIEEFESEVISELEESQHIPKVKVILKEIIKFFVDALSYVQDTFNLQNDLVLKMMAAKEDRDAKIEVEWKILMRSLAILAHRVQIKLGSNTPLELTKLPLLEMIIKELRLPPSQRSFSRVLHQQKLSDSYETNKLREVLYKELRKELGEEEKRNYKEIELQKLSAQVMMSSIKKAEKSLYDLTCRLNQLAEAEDCFLKDSEILRSLNETFKELRKLQYIQEDLALNLQNFESLTQEIVLRLQDSKDILSKIARRLEKTEDFEAEVKSELGQLQRIPERELILLETTTKFFLEALSHVQGTFNLQNDLVLKMMAAKEDHSREAKTEVELKNVTRSLAPRACRADFKIGHKEPLVELKKLPLLEMIIKVLKLRRSTDRFRRIGYKLASSDSFETKKLHEELYKGLREELSEEEKKNYKELCPTKNTEENNSLGLHRLESLQLRMMRYSKEEKAFWPGFYHPLFELLDFLSHFSFRFRRRRILKRESFYKLLIASGVLGSESLSRNESGTNL